MLQCILQKKDHRHSLCDAVSDGRVGSASKEHSDADESQYGGMWDNVSFMAVEELRRQTFLNWPRFAPVSIEDLVKDGFFYLGPGDRVQCAFCRRVLHSWRPGDNVREEHRRVNPRCPFLRGRVSNVQRSQIPAAAQPGPVQQPPRQSVTSTPYGHQSVQPAEEGSSASKQSGEEIGGSASNRALFLPSGSRGAMLDRSQYPQGSRLALPEGFSSFHLPQGSSLLTSLSSKFTPTLTEQAGRSPPSWEELSSKPGEMPSSSKEPGDEPSRKHGSEVPGTESGELATFPAYRRTNSQMFRSLPPPSPVPQTVFGVKSGSVPAVPSLPGTEGLASSSLGDEWSQIDAEVERQMASSTVQEIADLGIPVSKEDLRKLVLRLLLEQGRSFSSSSELANVLIDMEEKKLSTDQVELPRSAGSSNPPASLGRGATGQVLSASHASAASSPASAAIPSASNLPPFEQSLPRQSGEGMDDVFLCKICMERPIQVTFIPCGHFVCCSQCSDKLHECPVCRRPINDRLTTFMS